MNKSIYILEDNLEILEVISLVLSQENFEITGYRSASDFVEGLKRAVPDLCLLDVMLPDGHGLNICDHLKLDQKTKKTPVIMMTAHEEIGKMKLRSRADDFIAKPFDVADLLERIKKQLG